MRYKYDTFARYVAYSVNYQGAIEFAPTRLATAKFKKAVSDSAMANGKPNPWETRYMCYENLWDAVLSAFGGVLDDNAIAYVQDRYIETVIDDE